jgi:hypothetical protein
VSTAKAFFPLQVGGRQRPASYAKRFDNDPISPPLFSNRATTGRSRHATIFFGVPPGFPLSPAVESAIFSLCFPQF